MIEYGPRVDIVLLKQAGKDRDAIVDALLDKNFFVHVTEDVHEAERIDKECAIGQVLAGKGFDPKVKSAVVQLGENSPAAIAAAAEQARCARLKLDDLVDKVEYFYQDPANIFVFSIYMDVRTGMLGDSKEECVPPMLCTSDDGKLTLWIDTAGEQKVSQIIFKKVIEEDYGKKIERECYDKTTPLLEFVRSIPERELGKRTDKELGDLLLKFLRLFDAKVQYASLSSVMEFTTQVFTNHLKSLLVDKLSDLEERERVFSVLTTPTKLSYIRRFEQELARIGIKRLENKDCDADIARVVKEWTWINFNYDGEPIDKEWVLQRIDELGSTKDDFAKLLEDETQTVMKEQEALVQKFKLTEKEQELFRLGREIIYLKFMRKGVYAESFFYNKMLLAEIAERIGLETTDMLHLLPEEILGALVVGSFPKALIPKRIKQALYVHGEGHSSPLSNDLREKYIVAPEMQEEISGTTAYPGMVKGRVKHVNVVEDMKGFEKGMILVSRNTNPALVPAMQKAAAFVTDTGGMTCHAACVAREMKTPCVVGTGNGSRILKDGDLVEVDATNATVKIIEKK